MAYVKIRPRRSTAAEWEYDNPILAEGEMGVEVPITGVGTGFVKIKFGDGVTPWNDLPYGLIGGSGGSGDLSELETRVTAIENFLISIKPRLVLLGGVNAAATASIESRATTTTSASSSDVDILAERITKIEEELASLQTVLLLIDDAS